MQQYLPEHQLHPTSPYQSTEQCLQHISNRNYKKTHSHISTRKSSTDSSDLKGKFKTQMCKYYLLHLECPFLNLCLFAHGEEELRSKDAIPAKYKTKLCSKFSSQGYCSYGLRCQFIHYQGSHIINYEKLVDKIRNDSEVFFQFLKVENIKKPRRLSFFQEIEQEGQREKGQEQQQDKIEELPKFYNLAAQTLINRTRHNSI